MRPLAIFINIFILAGALVLMFLTVMAGSTNTNPLKKFYWIRADTSSIPGAFDETSWSFWGACDYNDFSNCNYGPAYPISPVDNFHTKKNVPKKFVSDRDDFYYLSRFAFAFLLIALFFGVFAFIIYILGFCITFIDMVFMIMIGISLLFQAGFASFMTAVAVLAKNAFNSSDMHPHLGVKLIAITWAAFACLLIVFFSSCFTNIANSYATYMAGVRGSQNTYPPVEDAPGEESSFTRTAPETEPKPESNGGIRFFKIKRNNQKVSDDESL